MFNILLKDGKTRDDLKSFLMQKRIFSKVFFDPIHLMTYYRHEYGTREGMFPITEEVSRRILTLPIYPNMTDEEKDYMIESIGEFFEIKS